MPVYQYACTDCHEELEVRQSFTDNSLTVCPACSGRLRKVLSAVGVVFKGSGFYRNDSRSKPNEAAPSSTESTKEAAATTPASTTESSSSDSDRKASQPAPGGKTGAAKDSSSSAKTSVAG